MTWEMRPSPGEIHWLVKRILHLQDNDLKNKVKVTKIQSAFNLVIMTYLCKFGENLSTGSKDILLTRHDLENDVKVTKY